MIILALDTTSEQASVAIRRDEATIAEEQITTTDGHSYLLFQMVQSALTKAAISLDQVDCFATASGPGSFTGLRICMTAAKGLAEATGKPASGISNLRALATFGSAPLRSPILDARRSQIYTAIYNSDLALVSPEIVISAGDWHVPSEVERVFMTRPLAAAIALCAALDGPEMWQDPELLDASYVRRSDAEMHWTDQRTT